jgi:septum formation protein
MVLASGSPRRLELLGALCDAADVELVVDPADVDETEQPGERPTDYVRRLAVAKAEVVVARRPGTVVVGADTTVDLDGHILAKPVDAADAGVMLARLSARTHRVHTGVAVVSSSHTSTAVVTSFVSMAPLNKAGAYAVQGVGAAFVTRVVGSVSNVVGLPLTTLAELLAAHGVHVGHRR